MSFLDKIFKKKEAEKENVGGMEDFMTLIRVYFQSALAANNGITNLNVLPDLATFKRTLHVPTLNNRLGLGEKKACAKMLQDLYGISDGFFKEIDQSIKHNCKNQTQIQGYLFAFQNYTQDIMMLMSNLMKWKFRIPGFMKGMLQNVIHKTVDDIMTKDNWTEPGVAKTVFAIRRYQNQLGFSTGWTKEYVYNIIMLAKKEPTPSAEEEQKALAKMKK